MNKQLFKPKKLTTSKIVLYIPYFFVSVAFVTFVCLILKLFATDQYAYISTFTLNYGLYIYTPTNLLATAVTLGYQIKSKIEFIANSKLYEIFAMVDLQEKYPQYEIYNTVEIRKDVDSIIKPIDEQIDVTYKQSLSENASTKVTA